ncbi:GNAT family N-acetyltransferase [Veronia pacifica]|uniref:GNAT family N-acetyltransferase n=1 Tax=Veronia pacifica TaxID=1080227 RepID=UPI000A6C4401|nr:GNAT family N-acetyltransferase [Veronia pacifica]
MFTSLSQFSDFSQSRRIRFPILLDGSPSWCLSQVDGLNNVTIVSDEFEHAMPWKAVKGLLGQELGHVVLDIRYKADIEKICAIAGCLRGGALLFFIGLPNSTDKDDRFLQRFYSMFSSEHARVVTQGGQTALLSSDNPACEQQSSQFSFGAVTSDQEQAIIAVERVLSGHRKRPLLLTADRGRGKSSAMGLAVGKILKEKSKRIVVTSPKKANVETLFEHIYTSLQLDKGKNPFDVTAPLGGSVSYIAPDRLLQEDIEADLLLVDESAAIPLPMLQRMFNQYSRVCFSTTEHGYEGTGRGFSTRFRHLLDSHFMSWREVKLLAPVRWAMEDPLEHWLSNTFLFDVEACEVEPDKTVSVELNRLSASSLVSDEATLRELFGLLVSAHYQTSPNDLVHILNDPSLYIYTASYKGHLVGALLAQFEGQFSTELSKQVVRGERRIKGHLLAQGMAFNSGVASLLAAKFSRITRIAVLPSFRRKGIASMMIRQFEDAMLSENVNMVGTSFGATEGLSSFWFSLGYQPIKLGVQRDAASGCYSLLLGKNIEGLENDLRDSLSLFSTNFPAQLTEQFKDVEPSLVPILLRECQLQNDLPSACQLQLHQFAKGYLGYDHVVGSLSSWLVQLFSDTEKVTSDLRCFGLLVEKILQRKPWDVVASRHGFRGRKGCEKAIQVEVKKLLALEEI